MNDLHQLTISQAHQLLKEKKVSSVELTKATLARLIKVEDKVHACVTISEDAALEQAKEADKVISSGKIKPLTGIPTLIKDNMCTKGIKTTCSSKILENFIPPYDATVIKKLKADNAVILGKTNMDEFAMGSSTENSAFFPTRNPWDLDRVPGGSSGGSVVAVATDEAIYALGSDTGGSIRQPAGFCSVVGFKPTYGRVSRFGLVAFASSLIPELKNLRLGIPKEYFVEGMQNEVRASTEAAINKLKELGAKVDWDASLPRTKHALAVYYILAPSEASANLARYDGVKYGFSYQDTNNMWEAMEKTKQFGFGAEVKRRIMLGTYALSAGYYDAYYLKAQKVRTLIRREFDQAFEKYDALITPTSPTVPFKIGEKVDDPMQMYLSDVCTLPINIAGLPAISIPAGFADGLPMGMQIIGKPFDEETILRIAFAYEQATDWHKRKPPI